MHPSTEDLLKLRDGEPIDARLKARLMADPRAMAELKRLQDVKASLGALPELEPPIDAWSSIQAEVERASRQRSRLLARCAACLAVAAGVAAVALLVSRAPDSGRTQQTGPLNAGIDQATNTQPAQRPQAASYAQLRAESARLERLLTRLPAQRHLMRVDTASTIAGLEDQIALIDAELTMGVATGFEPEYEETLWRNRVDVMNALVYVRYARSQ